MAPKRNAYNTAINPNPRLNQASAKTKKMDTQEHEEQAFRKKTMKRFILLGVSLAFLIVLIIGLVLGTAVHNNKSTNIPATPTSPDASIRSVCSVTEYPDSCFNSLVSSNTSDPLKIFQFSLNVVLDSLEKLSSLPHDFADRVDDPFVKEALAVCGTVLNDAMDYANDTISVVSGQTPLYGSRIGDSRTWLSTVITEQETCFDALEDANATFVDEIRVLMKNSTEFASNSLAIVSKLFGILEDVKIHTTHKKLLAIGELDYPSWVGAGERRLLQTDAPSPDVTVAKDGSGNFSTIKDAVASIPRKSEKRFIIYVKAGTYEENVVMDKSYWNVMIYGDGKTTTIVSGCLNFVDGRMTFFTATFAIQGKGFIARDIGFINTAGAEKHQAVALRSGSDYSVFYRCSFSGFQDTLYAHSNRQFYRECDITGTIDFIFGNSAVVLQNCSIMPRQPLPNQFVTITAQGKKKSDQNTGISIQRCTIRPLDALTAQAYLGRPWKVFSTTVITETFIDEFLNPLGWISWVPNVDPPSTIFFAESLNTGPGASMAGRVKWDGFKSSLTASMASKYNVHSFINGSSWLPATNVPFDST